MRRDVAYSGTVGALPMPIPRGTVCLLFSPVGAVTTVAAFLNGSRSLSIDWSPFGPDSSFPLDSALFGTVSASGSGSIQYAFLPRDLATAVRFDSVSPLLKGTLTVDGSVVISGTPSVSISGTPSVSIQSGTLNATITNASLSVANTVVSNGGSEATASSKGLSTPGWNTLYTVPAGQLLRLLRVGLDLEILTVPATKPNAVLAAGRSGGSIDEMLLGTFEASSTAIGHYYFSSGNGPTITASAQGSPNPVPWPNPIILVAGDSLMAWLDGTFAADASASFYWVGLLEPQ